MEAKFLKPLFSEVGPTIKVVLRCSPGTTISAIGELEGKVCAIVPVVPPDGHTEPLTAQERYDAASAKVKTACGAYMAAMAGLDEVMGETMSRFDDIDIAPDDDDDDAPPPDGQRTWQQVADYNTSAQSRERDE
jgi:hypothetical protein